LDLDIDLRTVERGLAFDSLVRDVSLFQSACELVFGGLPILIRSKKILVLGASADRELEFHFIESIRLEDLDRKVETVGDLNVDLIRTNEQVRVIDRESAN